MHALKKVGERNTWLIIGSRGNENDDKIGIEKAKGAEA